MTGSGTLVRNVLSSWLTIPVGVAYALVITPIVVKALDTELYGVWSFLNGLMLYTDLLYLGLGSALVRYIAQYRAASDNAGAQRLFSVVLGIYSLLGTACLAAAVAAKEWIPTLFAQPLPSPTAAVVSVVCVLLGIQVLAVFVGSAYAGLLAGYDRYDLVNGAILLTTFARFLSIPLALQAYDTPFITLAVISAVTTIGQSVLFAVLAKLATGVATFRPARPTRTELATLYRFGVQSFFIMFSFKLISYTDTTVIALSLGASSVAVYALPLQLMEYARSCVGSFTGVLLPRLSILQASGDLHGLRQSYLHSLRIAGFLAGWLAAGTLALGPAFLTRWVGPEYGEPARMVLLYLTIAGLAHTVSIHTPLGFYQALHRVSFPARILLIEAAFNLFLSIWLASRLGIGGVALATAIPAVLLGALILPPYLWRQMGIPVIEATRSLMPGALLFVTSVFTLMSLQTWAPPASYLAIGLHAAATIPVALSVFALTFPSGYRRSAATLAYELVGRTPAVRTIK